jgi:hypothetical protein
MSETGFVECYTSYSASSTQKAPESTAMSANSKSKAPSSYKSSKLKNSRRHPNSQRRKFASGRTRHFPRTPLNKTVQHHRLEVTLFACLTLNQLLKTRVGKLRCSWLRFVSCEHLCPSQFRRSSRNLTQRFQNKGQEQLGTSFLQTLRSSLRYDLMTLYLVSGLFPMKKWKQLVCFEKSVEVEQRLIYEISNGTI